MTRLHRRILGPLWPGLSPNVDPTFSTVSVSLAARSVLMHQMTAPGVWRAGTLFGRVIDDVLTISVAGPNGYRTWGSPTLEGEPTYLLGWADAVMALGHSQLDWVGTWVMAPDNRLPSGTMVDLCVQRGQASGLLDDTSVLVGAGLIEGHLEFHVYTLIDEQLIQIDVTD